LCQKLLGSVTFIQLLLKIDEDIAAEARSQPCALCGGPMYVANYKRNPRGAPAGIDSTRFSLRFSFCCGTEGCRKRRTPPSARYLGRRVYLGAVVVLLSAMCHGVTSARARQLRELLGVDRRTVGQWRRWWQETFTRTPFWKARKGRLRRPIDQRTLPHSLLHRFSGTLQERTIELLQFISPLTTDSAGLMPAI